MITLSYAYTVHSAPYVGGNRYGMGLMDSGMQKHRHLYNNLWEFWMNLPNADPFQTCLTLTGAVCLVTLNKWKPK